MQGQNLPKISSTVIRFFKKTTQKAGSAVRFVKRRSKLTAQLFAESLIMGCLVNPVTSLEEICRLVRKRGVKITKQGLHQRFGEEAVALMKNLQAESMREFRTEKRAVIDLLKPFSTVGIIDSTQVTLPACMKNLYSGCGGGGPHGECADAGLKIQLLLDYLDGQIEKMTVTDARMPDQKYRDYLEHVRKDGLYLQDLGYFSIETFVSIQAKEAFFVSRYFAQTKLYDDQGQAIDLLTALRKSGSGFSQAGWLHRNKNRIKVRLIASRLPDKEREKRLRKINEAARKKGRTPSQETLEFAGWSVYITNTDESILSDETIHLLYSLRWQIELFFKVLKSQAGLERINGKNAGRVQCEIYAKLICTVILLYLCFPERWQEKRELSFFKAYHQLRLSFYEFFQSLESSYRLLKFLKEFCTDLRNFALKEKPRRKRRTTCQKLMAITGQEILA